MSEPSSKYAWTRFWVPRGEVGYLDEDGFLVDPTTPFGAHANPQTVSLAGLAEWDCAVLLGEPGAGKSTALREFYKERRSDHKTGQLDVERQEIRSYGTDDAFRRGVFESPVFKQWIAGEGTLELYIDGFDECRRRVDALARILQDGLPNFPTDRLKLRIACRTTDWPRGLSDVLDDIWSKFRVFELLPLRAEDVETAAQTEGIDPPTFLRAVRDARIGPLAARPITLIPLLHAFREHQGKLPNTRAKLFFDACKTLCREPDSMRKGTHVAGALTSAQRLGLASRVAAFTLLTNKIGVELDDPPGGPDAAYLESNEFLGGTESVGNETVHADRESIAEVLGTSLFESRGESRLGWIHRSFEEYLAARYLASHGLSTEQIFQIFTTNDGGGFGTIPQLRGTLAWLCATDGSVRGTALKKCAEVFVDIGTDIAEMPADFRRTLCIALIEKVRSLEFRGRNDMPESFLRALANPYTCDLFLPVIRDKNNDYRVRRFALDAAAAEGSRDALQTILDVALDSNESYLVRSHATYLAYRFGDEETRQKLEPLLSLDPSEDPDEELKGYALSALWPQQLAPKSLFAHLSPPRRKNYLGGYKGFLIYRFGEHHSCETLGEGLAWLRENIPSLCDYDFERLCRTILSESLEAARTNSELRKLLAAVVLASGESFMSPFGGRHEESNPEFLKFLHDNEATRREIIESLVESIVGSGVNLNALWTVRGQLILPVDCLWFLKKLEDLEDVKVASVWCELLWMAFDRSSNEVTDAILSAMPLNPALAERFRVLFDPVEIDSPRALRLREEFLHFKNRESIQESKRASRDALVRMRVAAIPDILTLVEGEHPERWRRFLEILNFADDNRDPTADIAKMPAWQSLSNELQQAGYTAAINYLNRHIPNAGRELGSHVYSYDDMDGLRALRLLFSSGRLALDTFSPSIWSRWLKSIVGMDSDTDPAAVAIASFAYLATPDEFRRRCLELLTCEAGGHYANYLARLLSRCWDDKLKEFFQETIEAQDIHAGAILGILTPMLSSQSDTSKHFARTLVQQAIAAGNTEKASATAAAIFRAVDGCDWDFLWPLIEKNDDFCRVFVLRIVDGIYFHDTGYYERLEPAQLADLYVRLCAVFPRENDPVRDEDDDLMRPLDEVARWRDRLPSYLAELGSECAVEALKAILLARPDETAIRWRVKDAIERAREFNWLPPTPSELRLLLESKDRAFVRSDAELAEAILRSLVRLQESMSADQAVVGRFWNLGHQDGDPVDPRGETAISDELKLHLQNDFRSKSIVVNREVEIARHGDTDLLVTATPEKPQLLESNKLEVVVEVKGSWNPELKTAMERQLKNNYLNGENLRFGIYVVVCFSSDNWKDGDHRRQKCHKWPVDLAREAFDSQAAELTDENKKLLSFVLDARLA